MHIEFLVEDASGRVFLEAVVPRLLGPQDTSRIISYRGLGHLPKNLDRQVDPSKRNLLNKLPQLLRGYGRTAGIDAVVVVVDLDERNCRDFLAELNFVLAQCQPRPRTLFRIAIEELEAWLLGSPEALLKAYPKAKRPVLDRYRQDAVCGTWELLADVVYPGGAKALARQGYAVVGAEKSAWAAKVAPLVDPDANRSPNFRKFVHGVRGLLREG